MEWRGQRPTVHTSRRRDVGQDRVRMFIITLEQYLHSISQVDRRAKRYYRRLLKNWNVMCARRRQGRYHPTKEQPRRSVGRDSIEMLKVSLNGGQRLPQAVMHNLHERSTNSHRCTSRTNTQTVTPSSTSSRGSMCGTAK